MEALIHAFVYAIFTLCSIHVFGQALYGANTCIERKPLIITHNADLTQKKCAVDCFCFAGCSHIVFDRLVQVCRFYSSEPDASCQRVPIDISYLTSVYSISRDMCSSEAKYCPEIAVMDNTVMFGNINDVGTKRKQTCITPYALNGAAIFTCQANGVWSAYGQCVLSCPAPHLETGIICLNINGLAEGGGNVTNDGPVYSIPQVRYLDGATMSLRCVNTTYVALCSSGQWQGIPSRCVGIREHCLVSDECVDSNTECRENVCWCQPGLSFDEANSTCVNSCINYGDTFQRVSGWAMFHHDIECTAVNMDVVGDCTALCLSKTSYNCLSIDFGVTSHMCCMRDLVPVDIQSGDFRKLSSFIYMQRDCF